MKPTAIETLLACFAALVAFTPTVDSAPITAGNLVVLQSGNGSAVLSASSTAAFLKEYTTAGSFVQTIALPTAASGSDQPFTIAGSTITEGLLTLSANGQYLTAGGYATGAGIANIGSSPTISRVAGRIDWATGTVDTTTVLGGDGNTGNVRSVVSNDGGQFWVGTSGGGVRYTTYGSTTLSTQLNNSGNPPSNVRVMNIYSGQLYTTSATGSFLGVGAVGSGLPTTSGQALSLLPGFPTTSGPSSEDYYFADANTLYVADDRGVASQGLQKWMLSGGTWSLAYTLTSGLTGGLRGLAGTTDGLGNAILYATTTDLITVTAGNKLVTISDAIGATMIPSSSFTILATAPGNTAFRGVELIPAVVVPEPVSLAKLALVGLLAFAQRR